MNEQSPRPATRDEIEQATSGMLAHFTDNTWFMTEHWPVFEPQVHLMIDLITRTLPRGSHLVDVGCFNGYISIIFARLGYRVTGVDRKLLHDAAPLFERYQLGFVKANFNDERPLAEIGTERYDGIIIAQVIEHVLNHPLGVMRSLFEGLRPGGVLVLTTVHPAHVMGMLRLLLDRDAILGTMAFMKQPKFAGGQVIDEPQIHYREYHAHQLVQLVRDAQFELTQSGYMGLGPSASESRLKRMVKKSPLFALASKTRLFASCQYVFARRP